MRDQCRASPLDHAGLNLFAATWDSILLMDSAQWISEADRLTYLSDCVQGCTCGVFQQHYTLFLETPQPERTSDQLRKRISTVLDRSRETSQRNKQEQAIRSKIASGRRGTPGKSSSDAPHPPRPHETPRREPPKAEASKALTAKEDQLKHAQRQASALAAQLKQAGHRPIFPKKSDTSRSPSRTSRLGRPALGLAARALAPAFGS